MTTHIPDSEGTLVDRDSLQLAIMKLNKSESVSETRLRWVNWRNGAQIKMGWGKCASFLVYIDVHPLNECTSVYATRDYLLENAFKRYMPPDSKPSVEYGHGWTKLRYEFSHPGFIAVNDITDIADNLGITYSVIYSQDCVSTRPIFDDLGIPLVPGEKGKEWYQGVYKPYSRPLGKSL